MSPSQITSFPLFWNYSDQHRVSQKIAADINTSDPGNAPTDCFLLQSQEFIPWNNPDNIVSIEVEDLMRRLNALLFLPLLAIVGCPANVINMAVFYKQGLNERINVCLFALSLADEFHMLNNVLFFGEQFHLHFTTKEKFGVLSRFIVNNNLLGFFGFIWVSQVMSAIIAIDRCFCVLRPLRSQAIVNISTMTIIIVGSCLVIVALFFVVATRYRISCAFDSNDGTITMIFAPSLFYYHHRQLIDCLDVAVFGTALPGTVIVVVLITTTITTVKLRQATEWRAGASSSSGLTQREIALTKMLVSNSAFFIACVFPFCILRISTFIMPEMNPGRRQHNLHMTMQWILIVLSYFNSSFNIVVYYTMGSRYRQTFWQLFRRNGKRQTLISSTG